VVAEAGSVISRAAVASRSRRKASFYAYIKHQRAFERLFTEHFSRNGQFRKILVDVSGAYANFSRVGTKKGYGPAKSFYDFLSRKVKTLVTVDEFYTSQVCNVCLSRNGRKSHFPPSANCSRCAFNKLSKTHDVILKPSAPECRRCEMFPVHTHHREWDVTADDVVVDPYLQPIGHFSAELRCHSSECCYFP
jgi:hypothetical protein